MRIPEDQRNVAAPLFGVHALATELEHVLWRTIPFRLEIVELCVKGIIVIRIQSGCPFEPSLHPGPAFSLAEFEGYHLAGDAFIPGVQFPGLVESLFRFG